MCFSAAWKNIKKDFSFYKCLKREKKWKIYFSFYKKRQQKIQKLQEVVMGIGYQLWEMLKVNRTGEVSSKFGRI